MSPRSLIVNADDFGRSPGINRGIVETHERGIVTSASLMVLWPAAAEAAAYARARTVLSVGLHVDLGEWTCCNGSWRKVYERVDATDRHAVEHAVNAQLDRCRELLGRDPTHLDSHQHVHREEPVRSILSRAADQLRVPLRDLAPAIRHHGGFYGQNARGEPLPELIRASSLVASLRRLPDGVTELGCHPGYADDVETMYREERRLEVDALCAAEVRQVLAEEKIRLISFSELPQT